MKPNSPGCTCCQGAGDCDYDCWYACENGTQPCPDPCAIRINMPTPDSVEQASGPSCPPAGCTLTAVCNACLKFFDRLFARRRWPTSTQAHPIVESGDCTLYTITFEPHNGITAVPCWTSVNYDCPYETESVIQCQSLYTITNPKVIWEVDRSSGCAETTITIKYTVFQECNEIAILDPPYAVFAQTTYEHIFKKSHCDCSDVLGAVPFDSTVVTNNAAGVTLPDPCNAASATVELVDTCPGCSCFECNDFDGEMLLSVSGPGFTGTITLTEQTTYLQDLTSCQFIGEFPVDCGQGINKLYAIIRVLCYDCEYYDLVLYVSEFPFVDAGLLTGKIEKIACGESGTFTNSGLRDFCDIDAYTFSVPAL